MNAALRGAIVTCAALLGSCAGVRMRVDPEHLRHVETIAPVGFVANHFVLPPTSVSGDSTAVPEPTDATGAMILADGIRTFLGALRSSERFKVFLPDQVLRAKSYGQFPILSASNTTGAQLPDGAWRYVTPQDGEKVANLLEEIDADAGLIAWWRFTLDAQASGDVGLQTATPRAHLRAWLIGRDGTVVFDDEIEVAGDDAVPLYNGRYESARVPIVFDDVIATCAVRLAVDLSNARAKARGE
ncbi:MAG TPA: hypothetical protein VMV18_07025 [bacterium]|nr:hypothetical protein [bacterium]